MSLAEWVAEFRGLHEKAHKGQLTPREKTLYRSGRDELARALLAAQRLTLKPGETPRQALRVARALQVDIDSVTNQVRAMTIDISTGGFGCLMAKALLNQTSDVQGVKLPEWIFSDSRKGGLFFLAAEAPVLLVGNIDRGGGFASLVPVKKSRMSPLPNRPGVVVDFRDKQEYPVDDLDTKILVYRRPGAWMVLQVWDGAGKRKGDILLFRPLISWPPARSA